MMGFHRHGAYAAHFGLDTDNQWKVGGWSMGAVSYRILTTADGTPSESVVGSTLVKRAAAGYIYTNYLNSTADIPGGQPAYVAGQNGDNFLRWWPRGALAATFQQTSAWTNIGGGVLDSGTPSGDLIALSAARGGLAHVSCIAMGGNTDWAGLHIYRNGGLITSGQASGIRGSPLTQIAVHGSFTVAVNDYITIRATGTGNAHLNNGGTLFLTIGMT
jgi:hypothetical protein